MNAIFAKFIRYDELETVIMLFAMLQHRTLDAQPAIRFWSKLLRLEPVQCNEDGANEISTHDRSKCNYDYRNVLIFRRKAPLR